jgi:hypothetical protein
VWYLVFIAGALVLVFAFVLGVGEWWWWWWVWVSFPDLLNTQYAMQNAALSTITGRHELTGRQFRVGAWRLALGACPLLPPSCKVASCELTLVLCWCYYIYTCLLLATSFAIGSTSNSVVLNHGGYHHLNTQSLWYFFYCDDTPSGSRFCHELAPVMYNIYAIADLVPHQ